MPKHSITLGALALSSLIAGCAVGPDFQRPDLPASADQFVRTEGAVGEDVAQANDPAFWKQFDDDTLNELIEQAMANNRSLHAAWARLQSAQALLDESQLGRYPTVTAGASAAQQKLAAGQVSPGQPRSARSYGVQAQASWELDLFGRVRRSIEAQQADSDASRADLAALQLLIASDIAGTYADMRSLQSRLVISQANERNQSQTVDLATKRLNAGMGTELDVRRAKAQWQGTQSRIPALQSQIAVAQHRLSVLMGEIPQAAMIERLNSPSQPSTPFMLSAPSSIDPGTPAQVLRRRPDIAAAEARLHSATARIGVATADLFPRLSLGGLLGSWTLAGSSLFTGASATNNVVLGVDWSFLDRGRVKARIAASEAGAAESLAQYQQTVLQAVEETENALIRLTKSREENARLASAAEEQSKAEQLARRMYQGGSVSFIDVLDAQRQKLIAEDAELQSRTAHLHAAIDLYKALAGGWRDAPLVGAAAKD